MKTLLRKEYKNASITILQENLASLRAKAGLSQEEFAGLVGISRQTYHAIECGKQVMSWTVFLATVFLYHELKSTNDLLENMNIFPSEMFIALNRK